MENRYECSNPGQTQRAHGDPADFLAGRDRARRSGKTRRIPANLAVASVLTVGYVGIIAGPAAIGLIAHAMSLQTAFLLLCGAMLVIALSARSIFHRV